jgi:hypothetical protein
MAPKIDPNEIKVGCNIGHEGESDRLESGKALGMSNRFCKKQRGGRITSMVK